ncbi:MAG: hypothetical protein KGL39_41200 [Patescibacteria group bacterium]|nr:hypothetical protein [Patescibacteria group bacterium]
MNRRLAQRYIKMSTQPPKPKKRWTRVKDESGQRFPPLSEDPVYMRDPDFKELNALIAAGEDTPRCALTPEQIEAAKKGAHDRIQKMWERKKEKDDADKHRMDR